VSADSAETSADSVETFRRICGNAEIEILWFCAQNSIRRICGGEK